MIHISFKICFIISCLLVHCLKANQDQHVTVQCNGAFAIPDSKTGVCQQEIPKKKKYSCDLSSCSLNSHLWVPMNNCQLFQSPIKDFSNQQCREYAWTGYDYDCINPGTYKYTCPYTPQNIPSMICRYCLEVPLGIL
ncbi:uncharacterized protein MELLADRAFT_113347 [Melampsora larici-populina 98AG31]|uniref:Secreted protein n=1 Tax=Melampsora larici-populina (strain 98AG31 / pathotype 3-4-7) TaxID=747676 RepID=F4S9K6_MELLP|nr:uncharacterized protein MELLADRAFT_113347 [Melampsora larici-populina 98AG31]EGF98684.1 secreted protein [Melampsora larici-populina 98AG31]